MGQATGQRDGCNDQATARFVSPRLLDECRDPDFFRYAETCGAFGARVTDASELDDGLMAAIAHAGPALVEVMTDAELV